MTHEGVTSLIYEEVVSNQMMRVICRPYSGDLHDDASYKIETQTRNGPTEDWETVRTHWAAERPRVTET